LLKTITKATHLLSLGVASCARKHVVTQALANDHAAVARVRSNSSSTVPSQQSLALVNNCLVVMDNIANADGIAKLPIKIVATIKFVNQVVVVRHKIF